MNRNLLILLVLPLFLICLNESWIFTPILQVGVDPWLYFGYFLDLKHHLKVFADTYYGTRLPWILPGYLAYKFFSPLIATYVLHLTFYYVANFSLYKITERLFNQRTALLTAVLMGCHCFFLKAVGSKCINGAGLTYFLLVLLMLTPPEQKKYPRLRLSLAGIFYGCLIYTQLFLIVYTPLIILYWLFIRRQSPFIDVGYKFHPSSGGNPTLKAWVHHLVFFVLGFAGFTLFLCLLNDALNGRFFFYMPIVNWTVDFVKQDNPWWSPLSEWWKNATWLLLPLMTLCGSLLSLIYSQTLKSRSKGHLILFFQIYFIISALLHMIWEFVLHQPFLHYSPYASYLIPAMFLALGSQLSLVVETKYFPIILTGVIAAFYGAHAFANDYQSVSLMDFPLWGPILLGVGGVIAILLSRYTKIGLGLVVIALLMIHVVDANIQEVSSIGTSQAHKQFLLAVTKGNKTVKKITRKGNLLFWYDAHSPIAYIFQSIASTYLWQYRLLNEKFPQVNDKINIQSPTSKRIICILSEDPHAIAIANQNLAPLGLKGELIKKKRIQYGPCNFNMIFLNICSHADH